MVLDDVPSRTDSIVVAGSPTNTDVFGHGDLNVVDIATVPQRFEQLVREAQRQKVLHRLLAKIVVDAEHGTRREDFLDHAVEGAG